VSAADLHGAAKRAFSERIEQCAYPGRGLVVGRCSDGDWVQVYWIMGRSENSRNRRFVAEGATLRTEAVDPAKLADPSLVIYEAMLELPGRYVVSNGDQTRTVVDALAQGGTFDAALATREREPDGPHYTPRISALLEVGSGPPALALSILRADEADPKRTERVAFRPAPPPAGFGRGLTTYSGDGDPLPSFRGDPLWLPLEGAPAAILERYWQALDAGNRVALAVKRIPAGGGPGTILVRNQYA
jgi:IMP cyclohydrolase